MQKNANVTDNNKSAINIQVFAKTDNSINVRLIQAVKMTRTTQLRAAIAFAFCVNAILWQVSESATVFPPTQNSSTTSAANPCTTIRCTSPRVCQVDQQSNQPMCVCQRFCTMIYQPVCGSNGKTYGNECGLNAEACESNTTITTVFNGACDANPCANITCTSPRTCQVDQQSNQPRCVCQRACNRMYKPVCGSNGKTYNNECELNADACESNATITTVFSGTCGNTTVAPSTQNETDPTANPCATIRCTSPRTCEVDRQSNQPMCVCQRFCTMNYQPVCGSNGKTYGNECELNAEACESNTTITTVFNGACDANPCVNITCTSPRVCQVDQQSNQPRCVCQRACNRMYQPVCGSNGKTYSNECELNADACESNATVTTVSNGPCEAGSPCDTVRCREGSYCRVDETNAPKCACSDICTADYTPVCGSDGKTYPNRCALYSTSCKSGYNTTVAYQGECATQGTGGCAAVSCTQGAQCQVNDNNEARCVCNEACTKNLAEVCGSDGITYGNQCELDKAACKSGTRISVAYQGECGKATNPCAAVLCPEGTQCQVNAVNRGECVCNEFCDRKYDPVCGSDGKTYDNQCSLDVERCKRNNKLTVVCQGTCQKSGRKLRCRSEDI